MVTLVTDEKSRPPVKSRSLATSASMVGTEVSQVTPKRAMACAYLRASKDGNNTMLPPDARAPLTLMVAFMWNIGAATM